MAEKIKAEYRGVFDAAKVVITKAIAFGELLTAEKAKFKHGDWLDWVEANCAIDKRTAQRYMKLAKPENKAKVEAKLREYNDPEELSFNKAYALIGNGRGGGGGGGPNGPDYDTYQGKLVEKLKEMKLETAEAAVANTTKALKEAFADMKRTLAAQTKT